MPKDSSKDSSRKAQKAKLTPQQASLEDVFVRLTTREDEVVPIPTEEVHDA